MLHYGKSSGTISDKKLIHLPLCCKTTIPCRGVTSGARGSNYPGAESLRGDVENSQKCHKYFLQYSKFASIRPQIQTWGRQICFLPRTPSNLVTPLVSYRSTPESRTTLQGHNEGGKGAQLPGRRITATGAENPNSITSALFNVTRTFFNTIHLLPKNLKFEHGGAKVASCPGRHLTSLRPCCTGSLPELVFSFAGFLNRASVISFPLHSYFHYCFSFQSCHQALKMNL